VKPDLSGLTGTAQELKKRAQDSMLDGIKPIHITPKTWEVTVLGVSVGRAETKEDAIGWAGILGHYKLGLGSFVYTYTDGVKL
jgi:hypothetical protein